MVSLLNRIYLGAVTPHITSLGTYCGPGRVIISSAALIPPAKCSHIVGAQPIPDGLNWSVFHQIIRRKTLPGAHPASETPASA